MWLINFRMNNAWLTNYIEDFKWRLHFQFGAAFWKVVIREVHFERPNRIWRALKTSIWNTAVCSYAIKCHSLLANSGNDFQSKQNKIRYNKCCPNKAFHRTSSFVNTNPAINASNSQTSIMLKYETWDHWKEQIKLCGIRRPINIYEADNLDIHVGEDSSNTNLCPNVLPHQPCTFYTSL